MNTVSSRWSSVALLVALAPIAAACAADEQNTSPLQITFPSEKAEVATDSVELKVYPNTVTCSTLIGSVVGGAWRTVAAPIVSRMAPTCDLKRADAPVLPFGTYSVLAVGIAESREFLAGCMTFSAGAEGVRPQELQLFPVNDTTSATPNSARVSRCVLATYCAAQNPCK
jgi:hypothetical protein